MSSNLISGFSIKDLSSFPLRLNLHKPSLNRHIPVNINASLPARIRPISAMPSGKPPAFIRRSNQIHTLIHVVLLLQRCHGNRAALLRIRIHLQRIGLVTLAYRVDIPVKVLGHHKPAYRIGIGHVITPAHKVESVVRRNRNLNLIAVVQVSAVALNGAAPFFKPELRRSSVQTHSPGTAQPQSRTPRRDQYSHNRYPDQHGHSLHCLYPDGTRMMTEYG